jgi:hypothetical protein
VGFMAPEGYSIDVQFYKCKNQKLEDNKKHSKRIGNQYPTHNHSECSLNQYGRFILFNIPEREFS